MASWLKIVLLSWICTVGFCCNSGWYPFKDLCYSVVTHVKNNQMANNYCQLAMGSLAVANGSEYMRFFNTLPNFDGKQEYWIKTEGSWTKESHTNQTERNSDTDCLYAKNLFIAQEYCTVGKYFICERKETDMVSCPTGFDGFKYLCLRSISNPASYQDAAKFCALQQAEIAVLDTEEKEYDAKAAVIGKNQTFLIDVQRTENGYIWRTGEVFQPEDFFHTRDQPSNINGTDSNASNITEKFDCVGIYSETLHPIIFMFEHLDCDQKSNFLCQAKQLTSTTTEAPPTTTPKPLQCPHGRNWKMHKGSGYCFWETTYETERLNWFQARNFCKQYGGDLASYGNLDQEISGLGGARGHYRGLWIGLKRDQHDVFHWTDGSTLNFTNWNYHEPNLNSTSKFCVTHSSGTSKWQLDYCGVRRWFVCKAPKVSNPTVVDVQPEKKIQCEIQGVSAYRNQWYLFEDHCYMVHEGKNTWDTARVFCQDNGAHLASVHSFNETNFILNIISIFPDSDYWIGLGAHGLQSSYVWSDNTPLDFIYWSDNKTQAEGLNSCISFNKRDGSWNNEHCNRLQGVICKRGFNVTYEFTTAEPTTIMPGNCENGWYNYGNKCYKYFGSLWSQRLIWRLALKECEAIGASFVSIHSQAEQDFLTDVVLDANADLWIGLQSKEAGTVFHWSDASRMDYTNWGAGEPEYSIDHDLYMMVTPANELCVIMENGESSMGKWNDIGCLEKKAYICEKMKNPGLTEPYQDPFQCPNMTGWLRLGPSCYGFFEQQLSWLEAQAECRKYNANLITVRNVAVSIFVKRKLKKKEAYYWIGLREKMEDKYEYVSGASVFYTNWMTGQPRAASASFDNCVATNAEGTWLVKSCKEGHPFICRAEQDNSQIDATDEIDTLIQTCEVAKGDWYDFGGDNCYMMEFSRKTTWGDAMHYCFRHGGFLASFHSADEIKRFLKQSRNLMDELKSFYVHIGLGKKNDGSFAWVDGSAFDFTNWDEDQPANGLAHSCVKMSLISGKWRAIDCDVLDFYGFVCSIPKGKLHGETLQKNSTLEMRDDIISRKLTVGGIFGIIICLLVILAIAGVTVYYLRPTKQVQPKLLDHEPL